MVARIQHRLDELGMSPNAASLAAGRNREWWGRVAKADDQWPTADNLLYLCDAIGLRLSFAVTGCGPRLTTDPDYGPEFVMVPHVSWVGASPFAEVPSVESAFVENHIAVPGLGRSDYIALTVRGDSMDRVAPEGSTIIVDRGDCRLISRKFYVFSRSDLRETTFNRWGANPNRLEPYSSNPCHEAIFPDRPPSVVGRVVRVVQYL